MLRQSQVPCDHSTTNLAALCQSWRDEWGNLAEKSAPVANVVYDVMHALGVPDGAISQVLVPDEVLEVIN